MYNFRQGHGAWKVQIWENGTVKRDGYGNKYEYIFPKTQATIENHSPVMIVKKSISGKNIAKLRGWDRDFTFNYPGFTPPKVLDNAKAIVDFFQEKEIYNNLKLMLFPRLSTLERRISVIPSPETITIALMKSGAKAQGNKGVVLRFIAEDMITKMDIVNPNHTSYGYLNNL